MSNQSDNAKPERAPRYWMHEAIQYLGLDRLGLARPDLTMHRLIKKGGLHPRKICGRLVFDENELELVASVGDQKRERDRPNKFTQKNSHIAGILRDIKYNQIIHSNHKKNKPL